jgi:site-specific recombinase XerD
VDKTERKKALCLEHFKSYLLSGHDLDHYPIELNFFLQRPSSRSLVGIVRFSDGTRKQVPCCTLDPRFAKRGFLHEVHERYIQFTLADLKRWRKWSKSYAESINALISTFGNERDVRTITVGEAEHFLREGRPDKKKSDLSPYTFHKHFRQLRAIFRRLVAHCIISNNVWNDVARPVLGEVVHPILQPTEIKALGKALPDTKAGIRLRLIIILSCNLGIRINELLHLQCSGPYSAIDDTVTHVSIRNTDEFNTKNHRIRTIPANRIVADAIKAQIQIKTKATSESVRNSKFLFPNPQGMPLAYSTIKKHSERCCVNAGLNFHKFGFHSFRRYFGRQRYNAGMTIQDIKVLYGHKYESTTRTYLGLVRKVTKNGEEIMMQLCDDCGQTNPISVMTETSALQYHAIN